MPRQPSISNLAARDGCDAITARCDIGGASVLSIYGGNIPARADVPTIPGLNPQLAVLTMSVPAFGPAADLNPNAVALANPITDDSSANASGEATFFRTINPSGEVIQQGTVGLADSDLIIDNTTIVAGQAVQVISFKYEFGETP